MAINSIDNYYKILGITATATVDQIKQAYRSKAKELHPDKNKSPDAHEQFIVLSEAYECLINLKTGKRKTRQPTTTYEDWQRQKREQARQRAKQHARMRYEEFIKSDFYKKSNAFFIIFNHFYFFSSLLIIFGAPILGLIFYGSGGLIVGVIFVIFSIHYWAGIFTEKININVKSFGRSIILIAKTRTLHYILLTIINLILFFRFTLNTQIPTWMFLLIATSLYAAGYISIKFSLIKSISKTSLFLCVLPSLFNIFFLINFLFSSNQTTESYSFAHELRSGGSRRTRARLEKTSYIRLENNKYEENHWFRMFFDFDSMRDANRITYTFEDGLFGLRVLKSYKFRYRPSPY